MSPEHRAALWGTWISPVIGHLPWRAVTSQHAEQIRDALDVAIAQRRVEGPGKGRLLGRSALDAWHVLTGAVRIAQRTKQRDLRALEGAPDPCADVEAPGDARNRKPRKKTFVYPREFLRLMECDDVPLEWRQVYAIAAYTFLRPGELLVLEWRDVDVENGIVRVTKAWHYDEEEPKDPKTAAGVRDIPIHPHLRPLLAAMSERAASDDLVAPMLSTVHRVTTPHLVRAHLRAAGITRSAVHESSTSTVKVNFRSWRDTGITWSAMADVPVPKLMRRAGHDDVRATMRYIRLAEDLSGELGEPFPPLPVALLKDAQPR